MRGNSGRHRASFLRKRRRAPRLECEFEWQKYRGWYSGVEISRLEQKAEHRHEAQEGIQFLQRERVVKRQRGSSQMQQLGD